MKTSYRIGIFSDEEDFISSVRSLTEKGIPVYDVFTPYPVHDVFPLLKRNSRLPTAAYFFGLLGAVATLSFLIWACVISWPIVYGGKPFNSFPSFVVITIVITILFVGIGSLALFSARSKLLPGRENTIFDPRATDDKFVVVVETDSLDEADALNAEQLMKTNGAAEVLTKEFDNVKS